MRDTPHHPRAEPPGADAAAGENAVALARRFSEYARVAFHSRPELRAEIADAARRPQNIQTMAEFLKGAEDEAALAVALRRLRRRVFLTVMARDYANLADLNEVCATMSALADLALLRGEALFHRELAARFGEPRAADGAPQKMIIAAMGKLGGYELNVSSDIDLVLLYPQEGRTDGENPINNGEFFERLARRLINLLEAQTPDGFVFRVDLRLRPYGGDARLALSYAELEKYFYAAARDWERYAWIKARVVGEPQPRLTDIVTPFVYRKHLDFGAVDAIKKMREQIRAEAAARGARDNIKIGRGGIRDIEFFAQVFQLLRGGQFPALQTPATQAALAEIRKRGWIDGETAAAFRDSYIFLRRLEHRLQYRGDAQTYTLPGGAREKFILAAAMNCGDYKTLSQELAARRAFVSATLEDLLSEPAAQAPAAQAPLIADCWLADDAESTALILDAAGFGEAASASAGALLRVKKGRTYRKLSPPRREWYARIIAPLAAAAGKDAAALGRLLDITDALARHSSYLAILRRHPEIFADLARLFAAGLWPFKYLKAHPEAVVRLLERFEARPAWSEEARHLATHIKAAGDAGEEIDALAKFQNRIILRVLVADIFEGLEVAAVSDELSALADIVLSAALKLAWRRLGARRHRLAAKFAVIGYGRLGAKEMGYGSDLDLMFLYDDDHPDAAQVYAKLARQFLFLLGAHGGAALYDVDMRLRPDGASGVPVSSLAGFVDYQRKSAQLWEHQALTRARFVAGDLNVGAAFEKERARVLTRERDIAKLAAEIKSMRERIAAELGSKNPAMFDLKHDPGGMTDVEFAVQFAVLAHSRRAPQLIDNAGTLALLERAAAGGLLPPGAQAAAGGALESYAYYRSIAHRLRLDERPLKIPADDIISARRERVLELWNLTMATTARPSESDGATSARASTKPRS